MTPLDPRSAHALDGRTLLGLLPHVDQSDLHEIRIEFARYLTSREGRSHATWQDAWNAWTRATPTRPGSIDYTPLCCGDCKGRRFSARNLSRNLTRTGSATMCGECRGSGRGQRTAQTTQYAPPPVVSEGSS